MSVRTSSSDVLTPLCPPSQLLAYAKDKGWKKSFLGRESRSGRLPCEASGAEGPELRQNCGGGVSRGLLLALVAEGASTFRGTRPLHPRARRQPQGDLCHWPSNELMGHCVRQQAGADDHWSGVVTVASLSQGL